MSVEFELQSANGNFAFTGPGKQFLDIEQGAGFEPGDPTFTEKVFARSLLKAGATLALENLHEKEIVAPLKLRAANKESLTALVQEINVIIRTEGCVLKWLDEGATIPTYFSLISGQIDDEFDYRLGQNNWLKCRLRLFTQPLGYYSNKGPRALMVSGLATTVAVGTGAVITFQASGALAGDAPALMQAQIFNRDAVGRYAAISVLPSHEYTPFLSAASYMKATPFKADTLAPGGTYAHRIATTGGFGFFQWVASSAFPYVGEQRLLAIARTPSLATPFPIRRIEAGGNLKAGFLATPPATSTWQFVDLGVVSSPSSLFAAGNTYETFLYFESSSASAGASAVIDIAGLIQLPEVSTCWLNRPLQNLATTSYLTFDGMADDVREGGYIGVPASGISPSAAEEVISVGGFTRGAIPQITPSGTAPVFAVLAAEQAGNMNKQITAAINVLERTRYVF